MFQKIKGNIKNPKSAFLYIKESGTKIFLYILLMTFFISLPNILLTIANPRKLFPSNSNTAEGIKTVFVNKDLKFVNSKLVNEKKNVYAFRVDNYNYSIFSLPTNDAIYSVLLEESVVSIFLNVGYNFSYEIDSFTYQELGIVNEELTKDNASILAKKINDIFEDNVKLIIINTVNEYLINLIDYIFIAIVLTLLIMMARKLPIDFKENFKVTVNLMTIYAALSLITMLFGLYTELYYAILVTVYIYQIIAYKSVVVVKKN